MKHSIISTLTILILCSCINKASDSEKYKKLFIDDINSYFNELLSNKNKEHSINFNNDPLLSAASEDLNLLNKRFDLSKIKSIKITEIQKKFNDYFENKSDKYILDCVNIKIKITYLNEKTSFQDFGITRVGCFKQSFYVIRL